MIGSNIVKKDGLNSVEQIVQQIIRWYRTPRNMEVQDVSYQLQLDLQVTDSELTTIQNKVKSSEEESPKNFYFFIKRMLLSSRKGSEKVSICPYRRCDGSGYIFTQEAGNSGHRVAFKCKCCTRETKLLEYDQVKDKNFIPEPGSNYQKEVRNPQNWQDKDDD